jgi:hypothetical protein
MTDGQRSARSEFLQLRQHTTNNCDSEVITGEAEVIEPVWRKN